MTVGKKLVTTGRIVGSAGGLLVTGGGLAAARGSVAITSRRSAVTASRVAAARAQEAAAAGPGGGCRPPASGSPPPPRPAKAVASSEGAAAGGWDAVAPQQVAAAAGRVAITIRRDVTIPGVGDELERGREERTRRVLLTSQNDAGLGREFSGDVADFAGSTAGCDAWMPTASVSRVRVDAKLKQSLRMPSLRNPGVRISDANAIRPHG